MGFITRKLNMVASDAPSSPSNTDIGSKPIINYLHSHLQDNYHVYRFVYTLLMGDNIMYSHRLKNDIRTNSPVNVQQDVPKNGHKIKL